MDYDNSGDAANGFTVPDLEPYAPEELSRFAHFADEDYEYPGGLDKRFDMYLWATEGWPSIGGCGGDWGQRLSDEAYINMLDGTNIHVLEHELGHGFGITDFYGENGASDDPPPDGFPDDGTSIMMAGSSTVITDFDGWLLRYMWTNIKDEEGRFDIVEVQEETTTTTTEAVTTTTAPIEEDIPFGDANLDGEINISDSVAILSYISNAEKYPLSEQGLINADVNQRSDGISNSDALAVQRLLSAVISSLPESYN